MSTPDFKNILGFTTDGEKLFEAKRDSEGNYTGWTRDFNGLIGGDVESALTVAIRVHGLQKIDTIMVDGQGYRLDNLLAKLLLMMVGLSAP